MKGLEQVLQAHWTEFLDPVQVMRVVMEHVRDTKFKVIRQAEIPPRHVKVTVTKVSVFLGKDELPCLKEQLEVWIEFSIPKDAGVVIGTYTGVLGLSGDFRLKESFGTHFLPETS